jgi:hypothetical protein
MKKQSQILIILCIFLFSKNYAQCPTGNVTFSTQAEILAFASNYPNCTEINGDLIIGTTNTNGITSLSTLSNLTRVTGKLEIKSNYSLTSLSGLHNITEVGSLWIGYHFSNSLTSLSGLQGLTTIVGNTTIGYNNGLITLTGLDNLQTIGGYLWITELSSLISISSLNNLTYIGGFLQILNSTNLTSLSAFQNLANVNGAVGIGYTGLNSINAFNNLTTINGSLQLIQNTNLSNIAGLQYINPTTITNLTIRANPLLSICDYSNICTYLGYDSTAKPRTINTNAGNCIDENAVILACPSLGIENNAINNESLKVFKQNNVLQIRSDEFDIKKVEIYDFLGREIYLNTTVENILSIQNLPSYQILIIKIYSKDGQLYVKKVMN